jgi:hypothetical protein
LLTARTFWISCERGISDWPKANGAARRSSVANMTASDNKIVNVVLKKYRIIKRK